MYLVLKSSFFYGLTMLRTENIFDTLIWGRVGEKRNHIYKCSVSPPVTGASQAVLVVNNLPTNAGDIRDVGLIPGSGRSPGKGDGNPLQYFCLENPMDRGA